MGKVLVGILSGIAGFLAVALWNPFGGFDYAAASPEEKRKFLENKARNFSRGFGLTAGGTSEIASTYVDEESDLISITVQMKKPDSDYIPYEQTEKFKGMIMKSACSLSDRKLLTETGYMMRIRFFRYSGGPLMTVEVNGENCARYNS